MYINENLGLSDKVATIILAGGQGTRLHPLTSNRCKPHVSFGGKYRLIDVPISNSLNSKIHKIFVISQHFASSLQQHLSSTYSHSKLQRGNLEMLCPEKTSKGVNWFLGTADAVRKNIEKIESSSIDYYLILSGDQLYNIDLIQMVDFARRKKADLVIASLPVQEKEAKRMGLLKAGKDYKIKDFVEKPKDPKILEEFLFKKSPPSYLGSMGIYVFRKEALINLLKEKGNDFGKDLIPLKIKEGNSYSFLHDGYWEDIGTIESYYAANLALTEKKNCLNMYDLWNPIYASNETLPSPLIQNTLVETSIISPGCVIDAKEVTRSLIGIKAHIGANSVIRDSIIIGNPGREEKENPSIGTGCLIEKTIIDEGAHVGNNVTLVNRKGLINYNSDGLFIRDGIIVIPSGTTVPDGFTL